MRRAGLLLGAAALALGEQEGAVRLIDPSDPDSKHVIPWGRKWWMGRTWPQIYYKGEWGAVCGGDSVSAPALEAMGKVVCREASGKDLKRIKQLPIEFFPMVTGGAGRIWLDAYHCPEGARGLGECVYALDAGAYTRKCRAIAVECGDADAAASGGAPPAVQRAKACPDVTLGSCPGFSSLGSCLDAATTPAGSNKCQGSALDALACGNIALNSCYTTAPGRASLSPLYCESTLGCERSGYGDLDAAGCERAQKWGTDKCALGGQTRFDARTPQEILDDMDNGVLPSVGCSRMPSYAPLQQDISTPIVVAPGGVYSQGANGGVNRLGGLNIQNGLGGTPATGGAAAGANSRSAVGDVPGWYTTCGSDDLIWYVDSKGRGRPCGGTRAMCVCSCNQYDELTSASPACDEDGAVRIRSVGNALQICHQRKWGYVCGTGLFSRRTNTANPNPTFANGWRTDRYSQGSSGSSPEEAAIPVANIGCAQAKGLPPATITADTAAPRGSTVWLDNLRCSADAKFISDCIYATGWGEYNTDGINNCQYISLACDENRLPVPRPSGTPNLARKPKVCSRMYPLSESGRVGPSATAAAAPGFQPWNVRAVRNTNGVLATNANGVPANTGAANPDATTARWLGIIMGGGGICDVTLLGATSPNGACVSKFDFTPPAGAAAPSTATCAATIAGAATPNAAAAACTSQTTVTDACVFTPGLGSCTANALEAVGALRPGAITDTTCAAGITGSANNDAAATACGLVQTTVINACVWDGGAAAANACLTQSTGLTGVKTDAECTAENANQNTCETFKTTAQAGCTHAVVPTSTCLTQSTGLSGVKTDAECTALIAGNTAQTGTLLAAETLCKAEDTTAENGCTHNDANTPVFACRGTSCDPEGCGCACAASENNVVGEFTTAADGSTDRSGGCSGKCRDYTGDSGATVPVTCHRFVDTGATNACNTYGGAACHPAGRYICVVQACAVGTYECAHKTNAPTISPTRSPAVGSRGQGTGRASRTNAPTAFPTLGLATSAPTFGGARLRRHDPSGWSVLTGCALSHHTPPPCLGTATGEQCMSVAGECGTKEGYCYRVGANPAEGAQFCESKAPCASMGFADVESEAECESAKFSGTNKCFAKADAVFFSGAQVLGGIWSAAMSGNHVPHNSPAGTAGNRLHANNPGQGTGTAGASHTVFSNWRGSSTATANHFTAASGNGWNNGGTGGQQTVDRLGRPITGTCTGDGAPAGGTCSVGGTCGTTRTSCIQRGTGGSCSCNGGTDADGVTQFPGNCADTNADDVADCTSDTLAVGGLVRANRIFGLGLFPTGCFRTNSIGFKMGDGDSTGIHGAGWGNGQTAAAVSSGVARWGNGTLLTAFTGAMPSQEGYCLAYDAFAWMAEGAAGWDLGRECGLAGIPCVCKCAAPVTEAPVPAATGAPVTGAPLGKPAGKCAAWCRQGKHKQKAWAAKCGWDACSPCAECAPTPEPIAAPAGSCNSWCSGAKHDTTAWSVKCTWDACSTCSACTPTAPPTPAPCMAFCSKHSDRPWAQKCAEWANCKGCAQCSRSLK